MITMIDYTNKTISDLSDDTNGEKRTPAANHFLLLMTGNQLYWMIQRRLCSIITHPYCYLSQIMID